MYQRSLFPRAQLATVTEDHVKALLRPIEWLICKAIMDPWAAFRERRLTDTAFLPMEEVDVAWWMHRQILHRAKQLCGQYPNIGLAHQRDRQQDSFALNGDLAIVFKKIRSRFNPKTGEWRFERSNFRTPQNRAMWHQDRESGLPDAPRIIGGFLLAKEMTDIRLFVGYPRNNHRGFNWIYELDRQAGVMAPTLAPAPIDDRKKGFTVSPRKDAEQPGKDTRAGDAS